jgi:hypothetical protein
VSSAREGASTAFGGYTKTENAIGQCRQECLTPVSAHQTSPNHSQSLPLSQCQLARRTRRNSRPLKAGRSHKADQTTVSPRATRLESIHPVRGVIFAFMRLPVTDAQSFTHVSHFWRGQNLWLYPRLSLVSSGFSRLPCPFPLASVRISPRQRHNIRDVNRVSRGELCPDQHASSKPRS